jgi:tetratricopeptide (TPR) repeat protein
MVNRRFASYFPYYMMRFRAILIVFCIVTLQSCDSDKNGKVALGRGQRFYERGAYADAEIQFQRTIQKAPQAGDAWLWLGRTEERLGKYREALAALKQAEALMPGDDAARIDIANFTMVAYFGNPHRPVELYKEVSAISDELLAKNATSFEGLRLKGYLAMADNKPTVAVDFFGRANRAQSDQPDVVTGLVENLALSGRKQESEDLAHDFLQRKPDYGPLYTILYQQYMQEKRLADAEAILRSKVAHNPKEDLYRIELARHFARTGNTQAMLSVLNELVADPKDFPQARLDLGDFYVESRDWTEARRQYELGIQSDPKSNVVYLRRLVQIDLSTKDQAAAQRDLERILKELPKDAEARASRAALWMAANDPAQKQKAVTEFKSLVDELPQKTSYRLQYADALRAVGDRESAREQYRVAAQKEPSNMAALQPLADLSIQGQHIDDAVTYATRILTLDGKNVPAALVLSAALATKGQFAQTRTVLTRVEAQHPELREAQLQLALLDVEEHHYAEAEKRFRKYYVPGKGDVRSLEGLVALYKAQNQPDRAIAVLQDDLKKGPQSTAVRLLLAQTAADVGRNDIALAQFGQLSREQPESPTIAVEYGLACQASGDLSRAIGEFQTAAKLSPDNAIVQAYLAKALEDSGRIPEALSGYRRSLQLDERNPWVMNNMAYLLAQTGGDLNEALNLANEAVRTDPGNTSFSDTLGWVYLKKRDFGSAVQIFQSAREKSPKQVTFRIHLGQALLAAGDRNQSRLELQAALALSPTRQERERITLLLNGSGKNE